VLKMSQGIPHTGKFHPHAVALSEALDRALSLAKDQFGISAAWVAEYVLKVSPGMLSKYRNPDEPDEMPAKFYPLVSKACQNTVLLDALAAMHSRPQVDSTLPGLASLLSQQSGRAMAMLFQAMSPDSPGGTEVTAAEAPDLHPEFLKLQQIVGEFVEATRPGKAGAR
jgi:hypothetical protein